MQKSTLFFISLKEERKKVLEELWQVLQDEDSKKADRVLERYKV